MKYMSEIWHHYQHVRKRAKERFGITIDEDSYAQLNELVESNKDKLKKQVLPDNRGKHAYNIFLHEIDGKKVALGYSKRLKCVKTILFPEAMEFKKGRPRLKESKKLKPPKGFDYTTARWCTGCGNGSCNVGLIHFDGANLKFGVDHNGCICREV